MRRSSKVGYQFRGRRGKEAEGVRGLAAAVVVLASLLGGCTTAGHCEDAVPEPLRADVFRYAVEKRLLAFDRMLEKDRKLAMTHGRVPDELSREEEAAIRPHALNYAHCRQNTRIEGRR